MTSAAAYRAQSRHLAQGTRILNPVAAAVYAAQWKASTVSSRIHALIGGDSDKLVDGAGKIVFVVLTAAGRAGVSADDPDMRILRGTVEVLHEQAGEKDIPEIRRAGILSGLAACDRLLPLVKQRDLAEAALYLHARLERGDVRLSDFTQLIEGANHG